MYQQQNIHGFNSGRVDGDKTVVQKTQLLWSATRGLEFRTRSFWKNPETNPETKVLKSTYGSKTTTTTTTTTDDIWTDQQQYLDLMADTKVTSKATQPTKKTTICVIGDK